MNNNNDQVFQLFMEKLSGSISPEDEKVLEEMLSADPALGTIWHSLESEAASIGIDDFLVRVDAGAGLDKLKMQIRAQSAQQVKKRFSFRMALSAAAVLLLIMASGTWFIFFRKKVLFNREQISAVVQKNQPSVSLQLNNGQSVDLGRANTGKSIAVGNTTLNAGNNGLQYTSGDTTQNTLSVPGGTNYKITLSDGTEVVLNAATRLRFPFRFSKARREVYLEGEAFFKVAPDARRPFIVHTSLTSVNVLGTSFNVNSYEEGKVRTALVEGSVITQSNDGKSMELKPGYAAEYRAEKGFLSESFDEDDELSWMNGVYYFHDMPVINLTHIASRCYGIHIVIDPDKFSGRSVTGLLDRNKLSDFLNDLETTAHIKYYYSGNSLYLE